MVTSLWLLNKLSTDRDILSQARRQARRVGQYLSTNGYIMVKPLGGLSWRGGTGVLPMMEEAIARALLTHPTAAVSARRPSRHLGFQVQAAAEARIF
jgi:hypothetical protein